MSFYGFKKKLTNPLYPLVREKSCSLSLFLAMLVFEPLAQKQPGVASQKKEQPLFFELRSKNKGCYSLWSNQKTTKNKAFKNAQILSKNNKKKRSFDLFKTKSVGTLKECYFSNSTSCLKIFQTERVLKGQNSSFVSNSQISTILLSSNQPFSIFWNQCFDKSQLKSFVIWFLKTYGENQTVLLLEKLKTAGFKYASQAGVSISIDDLKIPSSKATLIAEAENQIFEASFQYERGNITGVERFQKLIDTWHRTSELLKQEVISNFEATDILNPVYMMAFSGARGNVSQVRQLVGMRGLMANPQGQIIDFPIRSNFREGLTLTEYLISSYGARKGIVDTALRTANAGYLTRRLVDVAQHIIVAQFDCQSHRGIAVMDLKEGNKTLYSLQNRLIGRVLAKDVYSKDILIGKRNQEISLKLASQISRLFSKIYIRSPLTCETKKLVCQLCYGWSLAQGKLVSIGETVGVIAAQSIGEPGTQLTMRTFHTGGVFSGDLTDQIIAPFNGFISYVAPIAGTVIRTPEGRMSFLTKTEGSFFLVKDLHTFYKRKKKLSKAAIANLPSPNEKFYKIPPYTVLFLRNHEKFEEKQVLAQISLISKQKKQRDDEEQNIQSDLEGEVFHGHMEILEQMNEYNEKKLKSWDWGYVWVLAGKVYKSPLSSFLFAKAGDFITTCVALNQIDWFPFESAYLDISSIVNLQVKKEKQPYLFHRYKIKLDSHSHFKLISQEKDLAVNLEKIFRPFLDLKNKFSHSSNQNFLGKFGEKKEVLASSDTKKEAFISEISYLGTKKSVTESKKSFFDTNEPWKNLGNWHKKDKKKVHGISKSSLTFQREKKSKKELSKNQFLFFKKTLFHLDIQKMNYRKMGYFLSFFENQSFNKLGFQAKGKESNFEMQIDQIKNQKTSITHLNQKKNFLKLGITSFSNALQKNLRKEKPFQKKLRKSFFEPRTEEKLFFYLPISLNTKDSLDGGLKEIQTTKSTDLLTFAKKKDPRKSNYLMTSFSSKYQTQTGGFFCFIVTRNNPDQLQNRQNSFNYLKEGLTRFKMNKPEKVYRDSNKCSFDLEKLNKKSHYRKFLYFKTKKEDLRKYLFWDSKTLLVKSLNENLSRKKQNLQNPSFSLSVPGLFLSGAQKQELENKAFKHQSFLLKNKMKELGYIKVNKKRKKSFFSKLEKEDFLGRVLHFPDSYQNDFLSPFKIPKSFFSYMDFCKFKKNEFLSMKREEIPNLIKPETYNKVGTLFSREVENKIDKTTLLSFFKTKNKMKYQENLLPVYQVNRQGTVRFLNKNGIKLDNLGLIPTKSLLLPSAILINTLFKNRVSLFLQAKIIKYFSTKARKTRIHPFQPFLALRSNPSVAVPQTVSSLPLHPLTKLRATEAKGLFFSPPSPLGKEGLKNRQGKQLRESNAENSLIPILCQIKIGLEKNQKNADLYGYRISTSKLKKVKYKSYFFVIQKNANECFLADQENSLFFSPPSPRGMEGLKNRTTSIPVQVISKKDLAKVDNFQKLNLPKKNLLNSLEICQIQIKKGWPYVPSNFLKFESNSYFFWAQAGFPIIDDLIFDKQITYVEAISLNLFAKAKRNLDESFLDFKNNITQEKSKNAFFVKKDESHNFLENLEWIKNKKCRYHPYQDNFFFSPVTKDKDLILVIQKVKQYYLPKIQNVKNQFYRLKKSFISGGNPSYLTFQRYHSVLLNKQKKSEKFLSHFPNIDLHIQSSFTNKDLNFIGLLEKKKKTKKPSISIQHQENLLCSPTLNNSVSYNKKIVLNAYINIQSQKYFHPIFYSRKSLNIFPIALNFVNSQRFSYPFKLKFFQLNSIETLDLNLSSFFKHEKKAILESRLPLWIYLLSKTKNFPEANTLVRLKNEKKEAYLQRENGYSFKKDSFRMLKLNPLWFSSLSSLLSLPSLSFHLGQKFHYFLNSRILASYLLRHTQEQETSLSYTFDKSLRFSKEKGQLFSPIFPYVKNHLYLNEKNKIQIGSRFASTVFLSPYKGEILPSSPSNWLSLSGESTEQNSQNQLILTSEDLVSFAFRKKTESDYKTTQNLNNKQMQENLLQSQLVSEKSDIFVKVEEKTFKVKDLKVGFPSTERRLNSSLGLGRFVFYGDSFEKETAINQSGLIVHRNRSKVTLRKGQPIFVSPKALLHQYQGDFVKKHDSVVTLAYQRIKTGDIVQGIPKIEQIFEARTTKQGRLFRDSLPHLLENIFLRYKYQFSQEKAVRQSYSKIRQIIVDGVQRVYRSQGVSIADKHIEVIVKEMTSKVRIVNRGVTAFFPGEFVDLDLVEQLNHKFIKKIKYEPIVLGISKASLSSDSFLSSASFQQTIKVLSKASVYKKQDFLRGLKENVIVGNLIPAGTGFLTYLDEKMHPRNEKIVSS